MKVRVVDPMGGANKIPDRNSKRHNGQDLKISISRCVYRRIQPRDASFWANFCGVFYSNDHVANYMQLHMVTAEPENQSSFLVDAKRSVA